MNLQDLTNLIAATKHVHNEPMLSRIKLVNAHASEKYTSLETKSDSLSVRITVEPMMEGKEND